MKKHLLLLIILSFIVSVSPNSSKATELPQDILEEELIKLLRGPILSVVGTDWFRDNEKILEIKQDKEDMDIFYVIVQVVTFQGPHNPPYMQEIITFRIKSNKVKPIDYFNRVIPESEWHKFQLQ
ncbi:DUF3888 domain-containing protein [Cytobacillus firmus]|uniref:DUF3888 domain-containing protein n=1 Tax=Cytobacillus firmus TaxID=1399 RepID=UPI0024C126E1|nr:DUF3888 domain-containing protein [Cytobacillus firmus]WHY59896.1 DUF3888 domain-containing protein [Cytobacillus firmus]